MKEVILLSHQKKVLKRIWEARYSNDGMIINHYMGTGKTLTGIYIFKLFEKEKKILVCPENLIFHWKGYLKNFNIRNVSLLTYKDIKFMTNTETPDKINKLNKILKDAVVVYDEGHKLASIFSKLRSVSLLKDVQTEDKKVNFNEDTFDDLERYSTVYDKRLYDKPQLIEFIEKINMSYKNFILSGTLYENRIDDLRWLINTVAKREQVPYNTTEFTDMFFKLSGGSVKIRKWVIPILTSFLSLINFGLLGNTSISNVLGLIIKDLDELASMGENHSSQVYGFFDRLKTIEETVAKAEFLFSNKNMFYNFILATIHKFIYINIGNLLSATLTIDTNNKDVMSCGKYFSFYKYENDKKYPNMIFIDKKVPYTDPQMEVLVELLTNNTYKVPNDILRLLKLYKTEEDAMINKKASSAMSIYYTKNGTILGNLDIDDKIPYKMLEIIKLFTKQPKPTIVYSSHYNGGIKILEKYIDKAGIDYRVINPWGAKNTEYLHEFETRANTSNPLFLLLHPSYSTGISINGCKVFHILEPLISYKEGLQLFTRVVRYNSHYMFNNKDIEIYMWRCSMHGRMDIVLTALGKTWIKKSKLDSFISYWIGGNLNSIDITPDDIVYNYYNQETKYQKDIEKSIKILSND